MKARDPPAGDKLELKRDAALAAQVLMVDSMGKKTVTALVGAFVKVQAYGCEIPLRICWHFCRRYAVDRLSVGRMDFFLDVLTLPLEEKGDAVSEAERESDDAEDEDAPKRPEFPSRNPTFACCMPADAEEPTEEHTEYRDQIGQGSHLLHAPRDCPGIAPQMDG